MSFPRIVFASIVALLLALAFPVAALAQPVRNIVLVHGAWVDGSGWRPVYEILTAKGFHVTLVQQPLTAFANDVAAARRILDQQDGPAVLVGHSYGGSVITEVGVDPKVAALVYVAAHAPDVGENEAALGKRMPSIAQRTLGAIITTSDGYTYLRRDLFPSLFAGGLPARQAQFEAQSQTPTAASVFSTLLTNAAWRSKPSWAIVAGDDKIINPDLERFYSRRARSQTTTIPGASHSVYESHPREVAAVIEQAARRASEPRVASR